MDTVAGQQWFLRKHADGTVFGPITFGQLAQWASSAQVAPNDSVSTDAVTWMKAPMLPELRMDWIVEITSEQYYGPTTSGTIREFLRLGEIDESTVVINACTGTTQQVRDITPLLQETAAPAVAAAEGERTTEIAPAAGRISIAYEEQIRELEEALREERRARAQAEERCRELEAQHRGPLEVLAAPRKTR